MLYKYFNSFISLKKASSIFFIRFLSNSVFQTILNLYNLDKFKIKFKLMPSDIMMIDNHRLLHERTIYEANKGKRFLQGCYIYHDSSEGKLRHLKRKFDL